MPSVRQRSEAVDVDCGQLVWRRLKDVAVVMDLHELAPVGGWAADGRHRQHQRQHPCRPSSALMLPQYLVWQLGVIHFLQTDSALPQVFREEAATWGIHRGTRPAVPLTVVVRLCTTIVLIAVPSALVLPACECFVAVSRDPKGVR
jgi:hypothetical protein